MLVKLTKHHWVDGKPLDRGKTVDLKQREAETAVIEGWAEYEKEKPKTKGKDVGKTTENTGD